MKVKRSSFWVQTAGTLAAACSCVSAHAGMHTTRVTAAAVTSRRGRPRAVGRNRIITSAANNADYIVFDLAKRPHIRVSDKHFICPNPADVSLRTQLLKGN